MTRLSSICLVDEVTTANKLDISTTRMSTVNVKMAQNERAFVLTLAVESFHLTINMNTSNNNNATEDYNDNDDEWSRLAITSTLDTFTLNLTTNCPSLVLLKLIKPIDLLISSNTFNNIIAINQNTHNNNTNRINTYFVKNCSILSDVYEMCARRNAAYIGVESSQYFKLWNVEFCNETNKFRHILPLVRVDSRVKAVLDDLTNCILNLSSKLEIFSKCGRQKLLDLNKAINGGENPTKQRPITSTIFSKISNKNKHKISSSSIKTTIRRTTTKISTTTYRFFSSIQSIPLHYLIGYSMIGFFSILLILLCFINASFINNGGEKTNDKRRNEDGEPASNHIASIITIDPANYFKTIGRQNGGSKVASDCDETSTKSCRNTNSSFHAFDEFGKPRLVSSIQKAKSDLRKKKRLKEEEEVPTID